MFRKSNLCKYKYYFRKNKFFAKKININAKIVDVYCVKKMLLFFLVKVLISVISNDSQENNSNGQFCNFKKQPNNHY